MIFEERQQYQIEQTTAEREREREKIGVLVAFLLKRIERERVTSSAAKSVQQLHPHPLIHPHPHHFPHPLSQISILSIIRHPLPCLSLSLSISMF